MRLKEIENRLAEIKDSLQGEDVDIEALKKEAEALIEERKTILEDVEKRKQLLNSLSTQGLGDVRDVKEISVDKKLDDKQAYRTAFSKHLLGLPLNDAEERAFVHTTENTSSVIVPEEILEEIYSQIKEKHPILNDVKMLRSNTAITIIKHTSIVAGDAKVVAENTANDDEENQFVKVTLSGKDFSKHVDFSYRLGKMSVPAFEKYLEDEISDRLGAAMAKDIVNQIKTDMVSSNKVTAGSAVEVSDILKVLGNIASSGQVTVYANNYTFYNKIAAIQNDSVNKSFLMNYNDEASGILIGKKVKEETALADGEILFVDPQQFVFNVVQDIMIERDKDIKKHTNTIAGFAIAEGSLKDDRAAGLITSPIGA